jgi:penicillin-binding protein 2
MARENVVNPLRGVLFYVTLMAAVAMLVARLLQLQFVKHEGYVAQAEENRITLVSDPAPRGVIYDRRGVQLVRNIPSFAVTITPADLPDSEAQTEAIYTRLAKLLQMPIVVPGSTPQAPCTPGRGIRDLVEEGEGFAPYEPVKIRCDIDKVVALIIREEAAQMPGVEVIVEPLRDYPTGSLTSTLIGYMAPIPDPQDAPLTYSYYTSRGFLPGRDRIGVSGIEASMQDILAGQNGNLVVEEDVAGKALRVMGVETETVPGLNLQLTIDVRLQAAAEGALRQRIRFVSDWLGPNNTLRHPTSGVAIVMNPNTGEILAMVSWPTYDNQRFARKVDYEYYTQLAGDPERNIPPNPLYPLLNHAVNILYPPGSVFKIVTATGVLEEKVIDPDRELHDPGKITIRNSYFPTDPGKAKDFVCWNREGHGNVDFIHGIAHSCNVYFYKIGGGYEEDRVEGLEIDNLIKWMELFGFGQPTGVELPGELSGFLPTPKWKRITWGENWATGDTYNAVIGQGYVHSTPLQMLNAYNVIINGGRLLKPTLVDKILDGEGNVVTDTQPVLIRNVPIAPENLNLIRTGLRLAVTEGTLEGDINLFGEVGIPVVDVPDVEVAGKTGTAEYCDENAWAKNLCVPGQWPAHAWTMLYAPYENPEVSVIVFVYNGQEGSRIAAPIAGAILRAYFELKESDSGLEAPAPDSP